MTILVLIGRFFEIIWEMYHGRISLNSVFLLLLVNFVSWFKLELMFIYIPHRKYQVKPHSSPWFSAACAAAIGYRNHFFYLYQKDNSSDSKVKFREASNCCKKVLEATILIKQKSALLPRNLALRTFAELLIVFPTKVNLLYFLYSTAQRCCHLHLLEQNCFGENFSNSQDVQKSHDEPWFVKVIWSWLYSSGGSKELWAWTFLHTSWTLQ